MSPPKIASRHNEKAFRQPWNWFRIHQCPWSIQSILCLHHPPTHHLRSLDRRIRRHRHQDICFVRRVHWIWHDKPFNFHCHGKIRLLIRCYRQSMNVTAVPMAYRLHKIVIQLQRVISLIDRCTSVDWVGIPWRIQKRPSIRKAILPIKVIILFAREEFIIRLFYRLIRYSRLTIHL